MIKTNEERSITPLDSFRAGWRMYQNHIPAIYAAQISENWTVDVFDQYRIIEDGMRRVTEQRAAQDPAIAQGFIAELWHTETFNLNAAIRHSSSVAEMLESTELGSADIRVSNDKLNILVDNSLKYYRDGASSANQQSVSVYQKFCHYAQKRGLSIDDETFKQYLISNGLSADIPKEAALYANQWRIIPGEQVEQATEKLEKDIAKALSLGDSERAARLKETKEMLTGVLKDGLGTESVELSREDSERIIQMIKSGKFELENYLDIKNLITPQDIFRDAIKSGETAALLSLALSIAPELIKTFQYLIKTGSIDPDSIKQLGMDAVSGSARGFITGSISAAITSSCKFGFAGEALKSIAPETIGAVVAMTYQIMSISMNRATGKMNSEEMTNEIIKVMFTTGCSVALGSIGASIFSPLGYFVGSLVGSMVGSLLYQTMYTSLISLCVDTGFAMFGLVKQDYVLPEELSDILGLDSIHLDEFNMDEVQLDEVELDTLQLDTVRLDNLGLCWIRRGVIGINRIGYVWETI